MANDGWIKVTDRLPEIAETYKGGPKQARVIGFTGHYVCEALYKETYVKREPYWYDSGGRRIDVTHWMPLPDPPTAEEDAGGFPV
jgi:hypothetical protein